MEIVVKGKLINKAPTKDGKGNLLSILLDPNPKTGAQEVVKVYAKEAGALGSVYNRGIRTADDALWFEGAAVAA